MTPLEGVGPVIAQIDQVRIIRDRGYVIRGNARQLPLPDDSVDLIITSPPYFALRSYRDGGGHYQGQIGSEAHPQEWLEALWACMAEWWRVLKPSGSVFVNLGDKRAGSGGHNNSGLGRKQTWGENWRVHDREIQDAVATRRNAPDRYNQAAFGRAKSKMLLPHRFAIGCEDGLADPQGIGWIVRQDLIWHKLNGLPESVQDRHRDNFEHIFHFTKQERYFAAMDEIREAQNTFISGGTPPKVNKTGDGVQGVGTLDGFNKSREQWASIDYNPLGKLPGSVWPMASEPLVIPAWAREKFNLPDHFAAFPSELPRKLILAFSPSGICVECGQGRRPVVDKRMSAPSPNGQSRSAQNARSQGTWSYYERSETQATITGYACACTPYTDHPERRGKDWRTYRAQEEGRRPTTPERPSAPRNPGGIREYHLDGWTPPPTRPSVVLDPFGGTGTVAAVANRLGRVGISVDLSADYCRLAQWRCANPPSKIMERTWHERQGTLSLGSALGDAADALIGDALP